MSIPYGILGQLWSWHCTEIHHQEIHRQFAAVGRHFCFNHPNAWPNEASAAIAGGADSRLLAVGGCWIGFPYMDGAYVEPRWHREN